ncbi:MAG TPA: lysophospholipase [Turneriella sp.]|nr:lysophospholipase [Turneriella sp.]
MQNTPFVLKNHKDGFELYAQTWKPESYSKVMVIQHGFGEHSNRYKNLLQFAEKNNTAVYALDARGHGKTPGKRGHVDDFNLYANDLVLLIEKATTENANKPIFLLGHSMGALVAALATLQGDTAKKLKGLVLSSGGFLPVLDTVKAIKKTAASLLANFVPAAVVDAGLDIRLLSRDEQSVKEYQSDPLVHGKISFRMGSDLFRYGQELIELAPRFTLPLYVFHGDADGIARVEGSKAFFNAAGSQDKTLKIYPGFYHETMNEPFVDRQTVLTNLFDWINAHAK